VRSGPGVARTILPFHIISVWPSKQPLMVRTFLKVYMELGSYFFFLQEQILERHHHRLPCGGVAGCEVLVCVYYCRTVTRTYYKAVCGGGRGLARGTVKDM